MNNIASLRERALLRSFEKDGQKFIEIVIIALSGAFWFI